jgi:hypothetical protein
MEMNTGFQGMFTTGTTAKFLTIMEGVDWIEVINKTNAAAVGDATGKGIRYYFQRGYTDQIRDYKTNATNAVEQVVDAVSGFTLTDTSIVIVNAPILITAVDAGAVVSTGTTTGLSDGDVVRLSSVVGGHQLESIDWQIDNIIAATSFKLAYCPAIIAAAAPGTDAKYRKIQYNDKYKPRSRYIVGITTATSTITTSIDHGYTVGEKVRLTIPEGFGTMELNGKAVTITSVPTASTFVVDIVMTGFTAFTFPVDALAPFTPAQVIPFGQAAEAVYVNSFDDAIENVSAIGVTLALGATNPGGVAGNVISWVAGKSGSVNNE